MSHYNTLGVGKDASTDEIKKAYRAKAQREHPDKGGDSDKFYELTRAYDVLSNAGKRAFYDKTGQDKQEYNPVQDFIALMQAAIDQVEDVEHTNIIELAKAMVQNAMNQNKKLITTAERKVIKYEKTVKRFHKKNKGGGKNLMEELLGNRVNIEKAEIKRLEDLIAHQRHLLILVDEYEYRADIMPVFSTSSVSDASTGLIGNLRVRLGP